VGFSAPGVPRRLAIGAGLLVAVLLVALVVLRLVGGARGSSVADAPPPTYDPPVTFAAGDGTALPREADADPLPAVLHGFDVFLALADGVQVVDTRSGAVRAHVDPATTVTPAGPSTAPAASSASSVPAATDPVELGDADPGPPILARLGDRDVVVAAYEGTVPGHGTTLGHDAVQLLAIDATSYAAVASARIDLPTSLAGTGQLRSVQLAGADGGIAAITVRTGSDDAPTTYGVDLASGRAVWQAPGLAGSAVIGGVVAGAQSGTTGVGPLTAVRLADGHAVWTTSGAGSRSLAVAVGGPALVAAAGADPVSGSFVLTFRDAATGAVRGSDAVPGGVTCRFDGLVTTVCALPQAGEPWAAGYDAQTGNRLWALPDAAAGRVAPRVSAAWHGAVYGTTDNGPVTLDAHTGADRQTAPGVAPDLVDAYVGVVAATIDHPRASAHLATS
jgi:hypothetical protein